MTKNLGEGSIPKFLAGLAIPAVGAMTIITSTSQLVLMPLQGMLHTYLILTSMIRL